MPVKYLIHNSNWYYPSCEEFETLEEAVKAFRELRQSRISETVDSMESGGDPFFNQDYLCIVIGDIDVNTLRKELTNSDRK